MEWTAEELQYMQKETQIGLFFIPSLKFHFDFKINYNNCRILEEVSWDQKYVIYLQIFFDVNERWQRCSDPSLLTTCYNQMQSKKKTIPVI